MPPLPFSPESWQMLNVIGACLYVSSGYLYSSENSPQYSDDYYYYQNTYFNNDATMKVHHYEMAASTIERK